jgi:hypothetical protein
VTYEPLEPVVQEVLMPGHTHMHQSGPEQLGIVSHETTPVFTWQYCVLELQ